MNESIETGLRLFYVLLFALSSSSKLTDLRSFGEGVRAYRLVPDVVTMPSALVVALSEGVAAALLALRPELGWGLAEVLLAGFVLAQVRGLSLPTQISCHCLNKTDLLDAGSVARSVWFLAISLVGLALSQAGLPDSVSGFGIAAIVSSSMATATLWIKALPGLRRELGATSQATMEA